MIEISGAAQKITRGNSQSPGRLIYTPFIVHALWRFYLSRGYKQKMGWIIQVLILKKPIYCWILKDLDWKQIPLLGTTAWGSGKAISSFEREYYEMEKVLRIRFRLRVLLRLSDRQVLQTADASDPFQFYSEIQFSPGNDDQGEYCNI